MRPYRLALPLLLSACASPTPPPAALPPAPPAEVAAATPVLLQLEHDWREACRSGDSATVARIEDESYVRSDEQGDTSRADELGEIEAHSVVYSVLENRDEAVSLRGDTATVSGVIAAEGMAAERPFKFELRFTDTFVRRNGSWKAVTSKVRRLDKPA